MLNYDILACTTHVQHVVTYVAIPQYKYERKQIFQQSLMRYRVIETGRTASYQYTATCLVFSSLNI